MSQRQAVIFDIGNVLIGWQPEAHYDAKIGEARRRAFFDAVPIHDHNIEIDRGAPFRETIQALAEAYPDWRAEVMLWHDDWLQMVRPAIEGSVATLRALRAKGIPVFALTNFGDTTFDIALKAYPFLQEFDRAFVSARMRLIKPDPAIYAAVEQATSIAPEALLFTDDRPENIEAAAARGWGTHLFTGWQAWAARLVDEGLLSKQEVGL
jgi:2-haloacid dehalogenase